MGVWTNAGLVEAILRLLRQEGPQRSADMAVRFGCPAWRISRLCGRLRSNGVIVQRIVDGVRPWSIVPPDRRTHGLV